MSPRENKIAALIFDAVRVTEAAALAVNDWVGRGDKTQADQAATTAMRDCLNTLDITGRIAIGEGERDEAPMLYIGEELGLRHANDPAIDIAVDPLEGTKVTAAGMNGGMAVLAMAERGNFLHAPDTYMEKLAVGRGLPPGIVDLDRTVEDNLMRLAAARGVGIDELTVCVLDRPRQAELIADIRLTGARVKLIGDGDVAACIAAAQAESGVDIYMGSGGAPEGVLAAAALRCLGGQFYGRLVFRNDDERERARKCGIEDLDRKYAIDDLAKGDVLFAATGITDSSLLRGIQTSGATLVTQTLVMCSADGSKRLIETRHDLRHIRSEA